MQKENLERQKRVKNRIGIEPHRAETERGKQARTETITTDKAGTHDQATQTIGVMKRKTINQVNITDRQATVGAQKETIGREDNTATTEIGDRAQIGITTGRDNHLGETKAEAQGEIIIVEAGTTARGEIAGETDFTGTTETDFLAETDFQAETDSPAETGTGARAQIICTRETAETADKINIRIGAVAEIGTHLEEETRAEIGFPAETELREGDRNIGKETGINHRADLTVEGEIIVHHMHGSQKNVTQE